MTASMSNAEARAALDEIERSRRRVIDEIDMPRWYWWGLALGWVGLGVITDLRRPWLTLAATLLFGAVHAAASDVVAGGRHRTSQLSVRAATVGRGAGLAVLGCLLGLAAGAAGRGPRAPPA